MILLCTHTKYAEIKLTSQIKLSKFSRLFISNGIIMRRLRALELCAGLSGLYLALSACCISDRYIDLTRAEIDPYCNQMWQMNMINHPDLLHRNLEDIKKLTAQDFEVPPDIISISTPCQDLSFLGLQQGLKEGTRSSLLFDAIRLRDEIQRKWPTHQIFFFVENVKMSALNRRLFNQIIGVPGRFLQSAFWTGISRQRLYWYNWEANEPIIPSNKTLRDIVQDGFVEDRWGFCFLTSDISEGLSGLGLKRQLKRSISNIVFARESYVQPGMRKQDKIELYNRMVTGITATIAKEWRNPEYRILNFSELEKGMGIHPGWTSAIKNKSERRKAIGNGWAIPTICYLLQQNPLIQRYIQASQDT